MKFNIPCYTDAQTCARQIVQANFDDILLGTFRTPTYEEMERSLKDFIDDDFDEYKIKTKIIASHPSWSDDQVRNGIDRKRMRHENEYQANLRQAAAEAISEIEKLVGSLNDVIRAWKITNLR